MYEKCICALFFDAFLKMIVSSKASSAQNVENKS